MKTTQKMRARTESIRTQGKNNFKTGNRRWNEIEHNRKRVRRRFHEWLNEVKFFVPLCVCVFPVFSHIQKIFVMQEFSRTFLSNECEKIKEKIKFCCFETEF